MSADGTQTAGEHEADIRRVARTHIAGLQGQVAKHRADVRERDIEIERLRAIIRDAKAAFDAGNDFALGEILTRAVANG